MDIEVVIKSRNRTVNTLVSGKKTMAQVLESQKFDYDPEAVELDGFLMIGEALHKPLKELRLPEKIKVSVTSPKRSQEAV